MVPTTEKEIILQYRNMRHTGVPLCRNSVRFQRVDESIYLENKMYF